MKTLERLAVIRQLRRRGQLRLLHRPQLEPRRGAECCDARAVDAAKAGVLGPESRDDGLQALGLGLPAAQRPRPQEIVGSMELLDRRYLDPVNRLATARDLGPKLVRAPAHGGDARIRERSAQAAA